MRQWFYLTIAMCSLIATNAYANWQISTSGSSSSSSRSQSFKLSQTFFENHRMTINQNSGSLVDEATDQSSSSLKLSYRYQLNQDLKFTFQMNQMDEYNLFSSQGYGIKVQKSLNFSEMNSNISFGFDSSNKKYSTFAHLMIGQKQFSIGFDQDINENLNWNLNLTAYRYETTSKIIERRLNGSSILLSEIDSYIAGLPVSSTSIGIDYTFEDLTSSISFSSDRTDPASSSRTTGQSINFDYSMNNQLDFGFGVSRSKEVGTTTTSQSISWSLSYLFP